MEKEKLKMKNREKILKMAEFALLAAIVIIFQLLGSFIKIGPTSINLVLIPVVIGSIVLGAGGGALLGLIGGFITLWAGISGTDYFTSVLFGAQPIATSIICLGKMTSAGAGAGPGGTPAPGGGAVGGGLHPGGGGLRWVAGPLPVAAALC